MYILSITIVIIASVCYTIFQNFIPNDINPIIALCSMYLSGMVVASIFYLLTKEKNPNTKIKKIFNWRIFAFGITNIIIDSGFLLAFRYGWEISLLNIISNVLILIGLTIIGIAFFKEKLSLLNSIGLVIGIIGLVVLYL